MNTLPTFKMDLYADWILCLREALDKAGFAEQAERGDDHICIDYFRVVQRQISARPRKVVKSKDFGCPPQYETGLKMLETEITEGQNLNPRLSRQMRKLVFNDGMLNDWGFHHLHLGAQIGPHGMVEGTRDLVYAWSEPETIYLIRLMGHNEWSNQEIFEATHQEWPLLFEPFRLSGVNAFPKFSAEERNKMRQIGLTVLTETRDGNIFIPPGGGAMSNGTSADAVEQSDAFSRKIVQIQKGVRLHLEKEFAILAREQDFMGMTMGLHLQTSDQEIILLDDHGSVFWQSNILVPPLLPFRISSNP